MRKWLSIQNLRALAALVVVGDHGVRVMNTQSHYQGLALGGHGVDVFFVISGFIISCSTPPDMSVGEFLRRRIFRVVPTYWLMTIVFAAAAALAPSLFRAAKPDLPRLAESLLFIPHFHATHTKEIVPILTPGWTLNYEMIFYVLFAAAMLLRRSSTLLISAGFLTVLVAIGAVLRPVSAIGITYTNPLLLEFIFGMLLATLATRERRTELGLAIAAFLVVGVYGLLNYDQLGSFGRAIGWGGVAAALIALFLVLEIAGVKFKSRIMLLLGDASYSIYLLQFLTLGGMRAVVNKLGLNWSSWLVDTLTLVAAVVVTCSLGVLMFKYCERPIGNFLKNSVGNKQVADRQATENRSIITQRSVPADGAGSA